MIAHHEGLIAIEYLLFAGGGAVWATTSWWRRKREK